MDLVYLVLLLVRLKAIPRVVIFWLYNGRHIHGEMQYMYSSILERTHIYPMIIFLYLCDISHFLVQSTS